MEPLLQIFAGLDGWVVYALLAVLVFGESAAVVALLLPGELALLAAGVLAARGHASLPVAVAVAVAAAICGHAAGYELGRRYGLRLLSRPWLRRYADAVEGAAALIARHGGAAVFFGRWMNVSRIVVPLLVGAGRMRYRTFTLYNVLGGVAWVLTFVLLGTIAGASLDAVERTVGSMSSWATGFIALVLAVVWMRRRTRRRHGAIPARRDVGRDEVACTVKAELSSRTGRDA